VAGSRRLPRDRRIPYVLAALAAVLAVGGGALFFQQRTPDPTTVAADGGDASSPAAASALPSARPGTPVPSPSVSGKPSARPSASAITSAGRTPVPAAAFPTAGSTGVPANVALRTYKGSCTITKAGTVIDASDVRCSLVVKAARVVIRKSRITGTVKVEGGANSLRIEDSDINGGQAFEHTVGFENLTVLRSDISGGQTSVNCYRNCLIQDSYLHGQYVPEGEDWHLNAFLSNGGSDIRLIGNTLACDRPTNSAGGGCTGNASIFGDFAPNTNYTFERNLFVASQEFSYCLYGGYDAKKEFGTSVRQIVVVDNVFQRGANGKCGSFGAVTSYDVSASGSRWQGNAWDDGKPVPPDKG
jgi:hypothetical protein